MDEQDVYVFWFADLWGWDESPGASTADLHRELEVGTKAMVFERWETTNPKSWFSALAWDIKLRGVRR
jgi:hypothetical protein